jgi:MoaA/NifB/PqqE/SkfB family radical SAM enzyme
LLLPTSGIDFSAFLPEHAERLKALACSDVWQAALSDTKRLQALRQSTLPAPAMPDPVGLLEKALLACNEERVRARIAAGERDVESLAVDLGQWPDRWDGAPPPLSFIGVNLTIDCNADPRCEYCNQRPVDTTLPVETWRALVEELTAGDRPRPYFSYTGGEPLIFGEALYGPKGLIRLATEAGSPSNVNTNALAMTPEAALALVHAGTARLHISLDSASPEVQDQLAGKSGRFAQIVQGIHNVQIAREALGCDHPQIHINCVVTTRNIFGYPDLVRFLLERKRVRTPGAEGPWRGDPHYRDLGIHLVPVGGKENARIRPSAEQWERFLTETWEEAAKVWQEYQEAQSVPEDERLGYDDYAFFANPYRRVKYRGSLQDYARAAADCTQSALGLGDRCLVVPTQAFFLPDGAQHWCGCHAICRPEPIGWRQRGAAVENIERALPRLADLPNESCRGCPVATIFVNQSVEAKLRELVKEWIAEAEGVERPAEEGPDPLAERRIVD